MTEKGLLRTTHGLNFQLMGKIELDSVDGKIEVEKCLLVGGTEFLDGLLRKRYGNRVFGRAHKENIVFLSRIGGMTSHKLEMLYFCVRILQFNIRINDIDVSDYLSSNILFDRNSSMEVSTLTSTIMLLYNVGVAKKTLSDSDNLTFCVDAKEYITYLERLYNEMLYFVNDKMEFEETKVGLISMGFIIGNIFIFLLIIMCCVYLFNHQYEDTKEALVCDDRLFYGYSSEIGKMGSDCVLFSCSKEKVKGGYDLNGFTNFACCVDDTVNYVGMGEVKGFGYNNCVGRLDKWYKLDDLAMVLRKLIEKPNIVINKRSNFAHLDVTIPNINLGSIGSDVTSNFQILLMGLNHIFEFLNTLFGLLITFVVLVSFILFTTLIRNILFWVKVSEKVLRKGKTLFRKTTFKESGDI